jgi:regulation of enolase protein 1 (concanavalin A-like superfamily)
VPFPDNPASVWVRVKRIGAAVEVYVSRDGIEFTLIRQGYLTESPTLQVGMMCAAPRGEGFEAMFEDYRVDLSTE